MRIYTRIVIDIETGQKLEEEFFEHEGPVAECKATQDQKDLAAKQSAFYDTLTKNYQAQFSKQSAILDSLKQAYDPIIKAGINQYGFDKGEDTALRTQASDSTARNYDAAAKAAANRFASRGGGNVMIPSGAEQSMQADIAAAAAGDESTKQLGITEKGYDLGRQNFLNATKAEEDAAAGYNPLGYAGQAGQAGKDAFDSATTIANENGDIWSAVGGILGGAASAFTGGFGEAAGKKLGGKI